MGMPQPVAHDGWTVEMLDDLPDDGQKYEIIDGELFVTPAPSDVHQLVVGALYRRLYEYTRPSRVARTLHSPSDVWKDERKRNRVQPDVYVVRLVDGRRPAYPFEISSLLLAAEVVSPSNPELDFHRKRRLYLSKGVPEYWILDADKRSLFRWHSLEIPGEVIVDRVTWRPAGIAEPLVIELPQLFEDALG
jgi:Uma2 family endonuclease